MITMSNDVCWPGVADSACDGAAYFSSVVSGFEFPVFEPSGDGSVVVSVGWCVLTKVTSSD